jgi:hypothetical protein
VDKGTYTAKLRAHLAACRTRVPLPDRAALAPLEEWQCRVLGGHLIHWLEDWGPRLLEERSILPANQPRDPEPLICFQSTLPGLIAAREILGEAPGRVLWGSPEEFEACPIQDDAYAFHVVLRSRFEAAEDAGLARAVRQRHPLTSGETYVFHVEESVLGPLFARGAKHLWKWDGTALTLLEEALAAWVS